MFTEPNYDIAAIKALEVLRNEQINTTPIIPLPVFKKMPEVGVLSFTEMSNLSNTEREKFIFSLGENMDAVTLNVNLQKIKYVVGYNQRLPFYLLQRGLARELGHFVLGHDGQTRTSEARLAEAYAFAHHFLCPRPLIHAIQESGLKFTVEVLGNMTGCYQQCLEGMREIPATHVPAELNKLIKMQFSDCIEEFIDLQRFLSKRDHSALADFGTYMDGYEE